MIRTIAIATFAALALLLLTSAAPAHEPGRYHDPYYGPARYDYFPRYYGSWPWQHGHYHHNHHGHGHHSHGHHGHHHQGHSHSHGHHHGHGHSHGHQGHGHRR